jgi:hypothetical protein
VCIRGVPDCWWVVLMINDLSIAHVLATACTVGRAPQSPSVQ